MSDDAPAYTFTDRGLIIVPGLGYEECERLWETTCAVHRQSMWALGDAASYSLKTLGESASQFISDYAPETVRVAMWVAERIDYGRRRATLSWSIHRELASLPAEEQDELLDQAEADGWRSSDMRAEVNRRKEAREAEARLQARYPSNGGPVDLDNPGADEPPSEIPSDAAGRDETTWGYDDTPEPDAAHVAQAHEPAGEFSPDIDELRACIDRVHSLAPALALDRAVRKNACELSIRVLRALGHPLPAHSAAPLLDVLQAVSLIPEEWLIGMKIEAGEHVFGGRKWSVVLRHASRPKGYAMSDGPHMPSVLIEAAIAAVISDIEAGAL